MNATASVKVAAAQYAVEFVGTWDRYAAKVANLVGDAAALGAQVLLFPEYACLELVSLFPSEIYAETQRYLAALQELLPAFLDLHAGLAAEHQCHIVAASFPVRLADGSYRNRAYLCRPDGTIDFQDKLVMTRWENDVWRISPGDEIKVFNTAFGRIGIAICYDSEFPLIVRRQAAAGASLILAPSCTDTATGYHRVKLSCRARALENQCYVVMAPVVGATTWLDALDVTVGAAGVFTPVDAGFPDDGILAEGALDTAGWLVADLDLAAIHRTRWEGQTANFHDWPRQDALTVVAEPEPNWLVPALVTAVAQYAHRLDSPN